MKKFVSDNIAWIILLCLIVAIAALVFAMGNRKKLKLLPGPGSEWYNTLTKLKEKSDEEVKELKKENETETEG